MAGKRCDIGPIECPLCGKTTRRRSKFFEAFPDRAGSAAAFPVSEEPPVPAWLMTECSSCSGVSPFPYPSEDEIAHYYLSAEEPNDWEIEHYVRLDLNPIALRGTEEVADKLSRTRAVPGRYLEVGCASGWILRAMKERGWEAVGIEAAPKFANFARDELGLDVRSGTLDSIDVEALGKFDLMVAFDVVEHLHNPVRDLATLRQAATKDALLVFTTPNIGSICARAYGRKWRQILPSHINFSTKQSAVAMLRRAGWSPSHMSEPRYWDPDPSRERKERRSEFAKFAARIALANLVVRPGRRFPALQRIPEIATRGKLSWKQLEYRIGDQAVLGDVLCVVAEPIPNW